MCFLRQGFKIYLYWIEIKTLQYLCEQSTEELRGASLKIFVAVQVSQLFFSMLRFRSFSLIICGEWRGSKLCYRHTVSGLLAWSAKKHVQFSKVGYLIFVCDHSCVIFFAKSCLWCGTVNMYTSQCAQESKYQPGFHRRVFNVSGIAD